MPVCTEHGCPALVDKSGYCPAHRRANDKARGSRQQRGYNAEHDRLRRAWAPRVATGTVPCAKCGVSIAATQSWDLGHSDDRATYMGPEHAACNRSAAGRKSHT